MNYTPEQQKVIELHNRNLLVSAAAGSGKTAVLVERIVQMLCREEKPVDIDRLLVVTFTKAAAAEMRERIRSAIEERLEKKPENSHLEKQTALLHNAQITTIDSFCQSVLRNNFEVIGLDPAFRVADPNEIRLIREDVLEEMLEEHFKAGEADFLNLIDCYQGRGQEGRIETVLSDLYDYALSFPWPEDWLKSCAAHYEMDNVSQLLQEDWMKELLADVEGRLEELAGRLTEALHICQMPGGPKPYEKVIAEELSQLETLLSSQKNAEAMSYNGFRETLNGFRKGKLSPVRGADYDEELKIRASEIRKKVHAELDKLRTRFFPVSAEQLCALLKACAPAVRCLTALTLELDERLSARKREQNLVDFSDMEHMALNILVEREDGEIHPTRTALDYRDCFEEILIDEYQDSNMVQELLLRSISGEDEGKENRFMVGDVKQSIYRFRLARPEIFLEKYASYQTEDGKYQKIVLHRNFRSRPEILTCVNEIFYRLMRPEIGHIRYDSQAALYPGASYPDFAEDMSGINAADGTNSDNRTSIPQAELLLVEETSFVNMEDGADGNADSDPAYGGSDSKSASGSSGSRPALSRKARIEAEAMLCAAKIRELVGHMTVTERCRNEETGEIESIGRPAAYRDIVILLRTAGDWFDIFKEVLEKSGIPSYAASRTGYFSSVEVRTVFNYLKILDNPLQDIPLYGVLVSPIGGFTEEEAARMRLCGGSSLYESLKIAACSGELAGRVRAFLLQYREFREQMLYTPIHELLRSIIRRTGYDAAVEAMQGGSRRRANLEMLIEKAVDYEQTSFHGLFHFMRYIDHLRKYEVDYGEAEVLDEKSDLVRIMTIHGSKGLEFPICFVCGTGKKFNAQDEKKNIVTHLQLGIGLDYVDAQARTKTRNLFKNRMVQKEHEESLGEELRVLYVALTRAKEKLIITGTVRDHAKISEAYTAQAKDAAEPLPVSVIRDASCVLDWILAAVYMGGISDSVLHVETLGVDRLKAEESGAALTLQMRRVALEHSQPEAFGFYDLEAEAELRERFSFVYPAPALQKLYTKTTVSELKLAALEAESTETEGAAALFPETHSKEYVPAFRRDRESGGTARGTAYHKALELLDLSLPAEPGQIAAFLKKQEEKGALPAGYLSLLRMDKVAAFRASSVADRMAKAQESGRLYREQPFVLGLPASRLNPEFPDSETVLIQGIIDVFWEEEDGLVVLDYKTDRIQSAGELAERYRTQLDYYAEALERLTHKPVKEKLLYSFALGEEICL